MMLTSNVIAVLNRRIYLCLALDKNAAIGEKGMINIIDWGKLIWKLVLQNSR